MIKRQRKRSKRKEERGKRKEEKGKKKEGKMSSSERQKPAIIEIMKTPRRGKIRGKKRRLGFTIKRAESKREME